MLLRWPRGGAVSPKTTNELFPLHQSINRRLYTHVFSLSFEVLAVLHQLSVHFMSHLLGHQLPLTGVIVELVQDGVEGQT